jgi:hypothetical protein
MVVVVAWVRPIVQVAKHQVGDGVFDASLKFFLLLGGDLAGVQPWGLRAIVNLDEDWGGDGFRFIRGHSTPPVVGRRD